MVELYPHKSGLGLMEPIALIGHNVALLTGGKWKYLKVTRFQSILPFQFLNLGAIAAQVVTAKTRAVNLEVKENEFGQFRWWVLDNFQARLWLPASTQAYSLLNLTSVVDPSTPLRDPCLHLTEFYVWEDERPEFDATNIMDYALAQARCIAMGYRFRTEALSASEEAKAKAGEIPIVRVQAQSLE